MNRVIPRMLFALVFFSLMAASINQLALAQTTPKQKAQPKQAVGKKAGPMKEAAPAQAAGQQWYSVAMVRVKPESVNDYEDLQKKVVIPALKKAGLKERDIWQTANFGEGFEYVVVTPIANLAQYDEPPPLRKALGEDGYKDYQSKARRYVSSTRTLAVQSRPDLSYEGKMATLTGPPKLAVVNSIRITPGKAAEFESYIKSSVLPVMKKADVLGYFIDQTVFGGDANEYTSLVFYDSFAEIAKGSPFLRVLGPEGLALLGKKYAGLVMSQERVIVRYNPELSFSMMEDKK